ncbi:MAG: hypothetical protein ACOYL5_02605 [Phototrophicaceae bacterium]|jgi:Zn-dependent M32 family carboxypeptidase
MDIQHLVDRLEDLIDEGRHMPMSKYTLIDEERALEIIDQMRISIPEEIEKAARILAQRDRVLSQAHEEAARIEQQAREKSEQFIANNEQVLNAQNRAANVLAQAEQDAEAIRDEADDYALKVFGALRQKLGKWAGDVDAAIAVMRDTEPQPGELTQFAPPPMSQNNQTVSVPVEAHPTNTRRQK